MRGIIAAGAYIPYNRLQRTKITETLGSGGGRGTRAVASYDEDATTMAVEASRIALASAPADFVPSALTLSTTAPPYLDKNNATAIQAALDLPGSVGAFDMVGSARSGNGALALALDGNGSYLVTIADVRTGLAGGADEAGNGDGAAALIVGSDAHGPVIAELIGGAFSTEEFLDRWRTPGDVRSKVWEERFAEAAYDPVIKQCMADAYANAGIAPEAVDVVVMTGLAERAVRSAAKYVGVAPDKYLDTLANTVGNTGAAHFAILLVQALENASPGQVILVINAADGCDAVLFRVTDAITGYQPTRTVESQIAAGNDALDYAKFLTWRGMLDREPPRRPDPDRPGGPPMLRSQDWKFAFVGSECTSCGARHLPPARVCVKCESVDQMVRSPQADIPGTIATFTIDRLAFSLSPPVVSAVVDFDGGGRYPVEMADVDPAEVKIGQRVEMTFRNLFTADGIHDYFWKARLIR